MNKSVLALSTILIASGAYSESYFFTDIKVGTFFERCRDCYEPDGAFPSYISAGYHWDLPYNMDIEVEVMHRSNLDLGFPRKGRYGEPEYSRDGAFLKLRKKFKW